MVEALVISQCFVLMNMKHLLVGKVILDIFFMIVLSEH
jgi:hypothetical protein